jgi:cobyrinic acid a,c-diamide synthase
MLAESMPPGIRYFGGLLREETIALPDRHLGLVQAQEVSDLEERLEAAAAAIARTKLTDLPEPVSFSAEPSISPPPLLKGLRIGVARDAAFAFLYQANLDLLAAMGADLVFFSPLRDRTLTEVDSLYLPGGYPELHLQALSGNISMIEAIRSHHRAGKPIYAECGGMLYLLESLTDKRGYGANMVGLLPGHAIMQPGLAGLGMQSVALPEGELRGHTFHHSKLKTSLRPLTHGRRQRGERPGEAVYRVGRLHGSYLHLYFPGNPEAVARLFVP